MDDMTKTTDPFFGCIARQPLFVGAEQYAPFHARVMMADHGEETGVHTVVGTAEAECFELDAHRHRGCCCDVVGMLHARYDIW